MNRSTSMTLVEDVSEQLEQWLPDWREKPLITGVSGGPDSMSLLYIFSKLGARVTAVHCNYQLRGRDSDNDQKLVEEAASLWGFEAVSVRLDPEESTGENFQNWARNRRYRIFRDLKRETGAYAIATAHHQDDQLETIIQKILRGAGLTAWRGMEVWNGELFRPLLDVSKAQLLQFASAHHVPYRHDSSNEESTYARNFLRNGWFPVLDDLFPGWRENMLKIPERAREHGAVVASLFAALEDGDGGIHREQLLALPSDVQKAVLLHAFKLTDPSLSVSGGTLQNLQKVGELQTGSRLEIDRNYSLLRDRDRFVVQEKEDTGERGGAEWPREELLKQEVVSGDLAARLGEWDGRIDPLRIQLDADRLIWPLKLRRWGAGDRINPFGMQGSQSVADHLTNVKVPADKKEQVQVIETFDKKICALIFPRDSVAKKMGTIADWARCGKQTESTLTIRYR